MTESVTRVSALHSKHLASHWQLVHAQHNSGAIHFYYDSVTITVHSYQVVFNYLK